MDKNISYSLTSIASPLSTQQANHLLNRTTFGANKSEITDFTNLPISTALTTLSVKAPAPSHPLSMSDKDLVVSLGETWINAPYDIDYRFQRIKSLRSWWIGNMIQQTPSLTEKMVLFWHNHFATEMLVVQRPKFLYDYNQMLREHALGNFKTLVKEICVSPTMLMYLNGDDNKVGAPNENFAREVFELFTIGKGPLIGDGNYTNYTEDDIREAAKVLTGWQVSNDVLTAKYSSWRHDKTTKTFSSAFGNHSIANAEEEEYSALIDMIFAQKDTARYLTRKIYRWLVYSDINVEVEKNIIEPLATTLFDNNYEILPLLTQLLSSEHFFSEGLIGAYIKNPLEFIVSIMRKSEVKLADNVLSNYEMWNTLYYQASNMEMMLGDPPDVAGWPQYYKAPQFNRLWINAATVPPRAFFSKKMSSSGFYKLGDRFVIDPLKLTDWVTKVSDPNVLIHEIAEVFLPVPLSTAQVTALKELLIPGLPDFEWGEEWGIYQQNTSDNNQRKSITSALNAMLSGMMSLPEFYLS